MAEQGADVMIHYNSDSSKVESEKTAEAVRALGRKAELFQGDLTNVDTMKALSKATKDKFGKINLAINTVGMVLKKPFVDTTEAAFDTMSDINSKSAYFFIQKAGRNLEDNWKIISIVTSLLGAFTGLYSTYAGAKAP